MHLRMHLCMHNSQPLASKIRLFGHFQLNQPRTMEETRLDEAAEGYDLAQEIDVVGPLFLCPSRPHIAAAPAARSQVCALVLHACLADSHPSVADINKLKSAGLTTVVSVIMTHSKARSVIPCDPLD
jgi:hypothetical protein